MVIDERRLTGRSCIVCPEQYYEWQNLIAVVQRNLFCFAARSLPVGCAGHQENEKEEYGIAAIVKTAASVQAFATSDPFHALFLCNALRRKCAS